MPSGDLSSLLSQHNLGGGPVLSPPPFDVPDGSRVTHHASSEIHGTTVIAVKFKDGVINVGDRRATANFAVMYDRAEKELPLDYYTLLAISRSFSRAVGGGRHPPHSF